MPFLNDDIYYELNSDAIHIHKDIIKMCAQKLNQNRCILISDAVVSAGSDWGNYKYLNKDVYSNEKGVRLKDNDLLIGSNLIISDIIKKYRQIAKSPLNQIINCVTYNPALLLGIDNLQGSIALGKEANLVIWDHDLNHIMNLF